MERRIVRNKTLPSFSIDIAELELLISKITSEFNADDELHTSITIKLSNVELRFSSVAELRVSTELPDKINDLKLYMASRGKTVLLLPSLAGTMFASFAGPYVVSAESDSEAWCAGMVDVISTTAHKNKALYSMINKIPFLPILFVAIFMLFMIPDDSFQKIDKNTLAIPLSLFLLLYQIKLKLFLPFTLKIKSSESIIRRFAPELALIFALVGCIAGVAALFK